MNKFTKFKLLSKKIPLILTVFSTLTLNLFAAPASNQKESKRDKFLSEAKKYIGCPYVYGAVGPDSFDCSGLIYYTAQQAVQIQLPRTAKAIYSYVTIIPNNEKQPGDLLFFKTTNSGSISHVGIYIGNDQFISAISDGPNTGVIVSSLKQEYWKGKYVAAGQFLPSGSECSVSDSGSAEQNKNTSPESETSSEEAAASTPAKNHKKKKNIAEKIVFDTSVYFDWSLLSPRQFVFMYRGIDTLLHVSYEGWTMQPGIGLDFRFNSGLQVFQMPLIFSLTANEYLRVYAGPVFTFGNAILMDTEKEIKGSVFPGIIGVTLSTPKLEIGDFGVQAVQDINYTVYNNIDGSALGFIESATAGLVMYTGLKISFPLSVFN